MRSTWVFLLTFSVIGLAILLSSVGLEKWIFVPLKWILGGILIVVTFAVVIIYYTYLWNGWMWVLKHGWPKREP